MGPIWSGGLKEPSVTLRAATIRLAHENPELRGVLLPLLQKEATKPDLIGLQKAMIDSLRDALGYQASLQELMGTRAGSMTDFNAIEDLRCALHKALQEVLAVTEAVRWAHTVGPPVWGGGVAS